MSGTYSRPAPAVALRLLGVGSPQGDDQVGWFVVDGLRAALQEPGVEVLRLDRPGPRLLDFFRGTSHVIIVDALRSDDAPGTPRHWDAVATPVAPWRVGGVSSHGIGVQEVIALARELNQLPVRCDVLGIAGSAWEYGATLSQPVADAVPHAAAEIRRILAQR